MGFFGWVFLDGFFWVGFLMPTLNLQGGQMKSGQIVFLDKKNIKHSFFNRFI